MSQFPFVDSVTYGEAPIGYRANGMAIPLLPNKRYSVIVLRESEYGTADFSL